MNGVHDMGGMHGMGPIQYEKNEPVFHANWEARVFAINRALGAWGRWNIDASRYQKELIPPAEYLQMTYYERFLVSMTELAVNTGLLTRSELESGKPDEDSRKLTPPLTTEKVAGLISKGVPASRNVPAAPRFSIGQQVRARNLNPIGHTRLPRYVRGKRATIERDHGVFVFPDSNAQFLGEKPQHVYSVRFTARELWGDQANAHDVVYVNLWDDYLEPA